MARRSEDHLLQHEHSEVVVPTGESVVSGRWLDEIGNS
jgi:hypothetical protein